MIGLEGHCKNPIPRLVRGIMKAGFDVLSLDRIALHDLIERFARGKVVENDRNHHASPFHTQSAVTDGGIGGESCLPIHGVCFLGRKRVSPSSLRFHRRPLVENVKPVADWASVAMALTLSATDRFLISRL